MSGVVSGCHNAGKGQDGPQHTIIRPERQQGPGRGLCCLEFTKASTEPLLCAGLHSNPTRRWGHGAPRHTAMTGQRRDSNLDAPDSKPQPGAIPEEPDPPGPEWGLQNPHASPHFGEAEVRAGPFHRNPCYGLSRGGVGGMWSCFTCRLSVS